LVYSLYDYYSWLYPKEYAIDYIYENRDVLKFDYEILARKTYPPLTMGFEVEQSPIMFRKRICQIKKCIEDGSGPAETSFGVYTYPMAGLKEFMDTVGNDTWEWVAQYDPRVYGGRLSLYSRRAGTEYNGCGSHWHFRPHFKVLYDRFGHKFVDLEEFIRKTWALVWNSLMELVYILLPLQMWHYYPRFSAKTWAKFRYERYNPNSEKFLRLIDREHFTRKNPLEDPIDCSMLMECEKHETYENGYPIRYDIVAFSYCAADVIDPETGREDRKCNQKPITIEWRLPEVHPAMWATATLIIINCIRFYFDRDYWSPKPREIAGMKPRRAYEEIYNKIVNDHNSWVDVFEEMGPVKFVEGRGPHPWKPTKTEWRNMRELFNDLLRIPMLNKGTPYYRVAALLKAGCSPVEQEPDDWWNILAPRGHFRWSNCRVETE